MKKLVLPIPKEGIKLTHNNTSIASEVDVALQFVKTLVTSNIKTQINF